MKLGTVGCHAWTLCGGECVCECVSEGGTCFPLAFFIFLAPLYPLSVVCLF